MEFIEVSGYLIRLMLQVLRGVPVLKALLVKPNGDNVIVTLREPPEWLHIGARLECKCIALEDGSGVVAEYVSESKRLDPVKTIELEVEEVKEALDGSLLVSGRRGDGRYFSTRLNPRQKLGDLRAGDRVVGLFTERGAIQNLLAVVPVNELHLFERLNNLLGDVMRAQEEHPEDEYLSNALDEIK
ncbi:MAG: hypothetical protein RMJ06_00120 [Nitrososphaerota archaeon]|nr:hypothetical protein [Nitrososphaerota archaeon]